MISSKLKEYLTEWRTNNRKIVNCYVDCGLLWTSNFILKNMHCLPFWIRFSWYFVIAKSSTDVSTPSLNKIVLEINYMERSFVEKNYWYHCHLVIFNQNYHTCTIEIRIIPRLFRTAVANSKYIFIYFLQSSCILSFPMLWVCNMHSKRENY